ncbi:ParB/RepB/Spo0J family partition protein [uncultured Desulfuromusa sp.]|uniref:ParB/RepB/Spo0J family partition protein n=1 Tax=uncultured Desulfuromusa sp. TaxID=219183 RepID=UPI002AA93C2F|nr:ParB/RepB/Spo0J family partition protein [uncultured Desulfuromusa sp.]
MSKTETDNAIFAKIPLDQLMVTEQNARQFNDNNSRLRLSKFNELVASIREQGIIEPVVVREIADDQYQIIAGERRYRAAAKVAADAGIAPFYYHVPCMVRQANDDEAFDLALIENLQREDLSPFEAASAFKDYLDRHTDNPDSVSDLAARTGIPAHAIRRQVRLLNLPTEVLNVWGDGTITTTHVEALTRIDDRDICLQVLGECLRRKLSARELREHINGISPDLDKGFFDKTECQTCPSNTSLQSGLFAEEETDGKCINPSCFEKKQSYFLTENWFKSKAAEKYGTRGFRFGHRLGQESREPIVAETAERCLGCDQFISVLRLTGMVVSMYERTCVGPRECFEELYRQPVDTNEVEKQEVEEIEATRTTTEDLEKSADDIIKKDDKKKPVTKKKTAASKPENGPVFSAQRAEKHREIFFANRLPALLATTSPDQAKSQRLVVLALALTSSAARTELVAALGSNGTAEDLAEKIFEIPLEDLPGQIQRLAIAQVMSTSYSNNSTPAVRQIVGKNYGLELHKDWQLTEDYLRDLKKAEIVKVGEEERINLWNDEKVQSFRRENYPNKALMALKRDELIDVIFNSCADLAGRVPKEILGEKK